MKLLLDTHLFLWAVSDPDRLSSSARQAIQDDANQVLLSVASAWEMAIKLKIGKLALEGTATAFVQRHLISHRFRLLAIELARLARLEKLPLHHRDPFDRLLVAQCIEEGALLVTGDSLLRRYPVKILE